MDTSSRLAKAEIRQLNSDLSAEINRDNWVTVQFNPELLKVSFANQIATPTGASSRQFVGAGTTKLSLQLWFDVTAPSPDGSPQPDDVRRLTQKVAYYITPYQTQDNPPQYVPPVLRFLWGSFRFDGLMDTLEESLEFFSNDGRPLRASMSLGISQQKILAFAFNSVARRPPGAGGLPGGSAAGAGPLAQAQAGATIQGMASAQGIGGDWQQIAAANGIENPRLLQPGQFVDMSARADVQLGAGASGASIGG